MTVDLVATSSRWIGPKADFKRSTTTGAPWVDHPTERTAKGLPRRVQYARASGFGYVGRSPVLEQLDQRYLIIGVGLTLDHGDLAALRDLDPEDVATARQIDAAIAACLDVAGADYKARRGSWCHAVTEYADRGEDIPTDLAAEGERFRIDPLELAERWIAFLARNDLTVLAIEQRIVHDELRAAGSLDRVFELGRPLRFGRRAIPAGSVVVGDTKTSALWMAAGVPAYWMPYSVQIAIYADGTPYFPSADGRQPDRRVDWPWDVSTTDGLIMHINVNPEADGGELLDMALWHTDVAAGLEAAYVIRAARDAAARRDLFVPAT